MSLHVPARLVTSKLSTTTFICNQCRNATLLRRPKRPYTFTQLITLSDGSTFTHRTTSPQTVYRSTRDTRNVLLWNPSNERLLNIEDDEAGRLAAFRSRYGRGWDSTTTVSASETSEKPTEDAATPPEQYEAEFDEEDDNLLDLISSFGQEEPPQGSKKKK
ncbi:hypothetical protein FQN57_006919 [Myotisia sp. PD_48]|nr:hypothetical protein FQN57_006919 [Myotisia sp. PD_48]